MHFLGGSGYVTSLKGSDCDVKATMTSLTDEDTLLGHRLIAMNLFIEKIAQL